MKEYEQEAIYKSKTYGYENLHILDKAQVKKEPKNVLPTSPINIRAGFQFQIRKPNIIANTKLKYLIGVTKEASANL